MSDAAPSGPLLITGAPGWLADAVLTELQGASCGALFVSEP